MRKLLLTSAGITTPKIARALLDLVGKSVSDIKVLFIPTAARMSKDPWYIANSRKKLLNIGIKNIVDFEIRKTSWDEIEDFDMMYMCGGNAFYLLKCIREANFDKMIEKFLDSGKVYVGRSAGSYVACPTIETASWKHADKNLVGLKDLTALNLVPFLVTTHYELKYKKIIDENESKSKYKVVRLTDDQAILILGEKEQLIK